MWIGFSFVILGLLLTCRAIFVKHESVNDVIENTITLVTRFMLFPFDSMIPEWVHTKKSNKILLIAVLVFFDSLHALATVLHYLNLVKEENVARIAFLSVVILMAVLVAWNFVSGRRKGVG
jgi:hypothetical protein